MSELSHIDDTGRASMVDISAKADTQREAVVQGRIKMSAETLEAIRGNQITKGDVLATARIAGIMAAKKTGDLIPLCHPLPLTNVSLDFVFENYAIAVTGRANTVGKTGVEMEAMTAVTVALLTIYDMAKAVQKDMEIGQVRLLRKTGGKSGEWTAS